MLKGTLRTGAAFFCGMAVLALGMALADDHKHDHGDHDHDHGMPDMGEMTPEMAKMMEGWQKYMTPGEHHQELMKHAGAWDVQMHMWQAPGAPMETGTATVEAKPMMDGRYLMEKFSSEFNGMPFEGINIIGYDNFTGKPCSVWFDNMGTGIMYSEGHVDEDGVTHMTTKHPNFITGEYEEMKMEIHHLDADKSKMVFRIPDGEGGWHKNMEMVYTRAGHGKTKTAKTHK